MSGLRFDLRQRRRECASCGRLVYLNGNGLYRRHFVADPDGRRHLCAGSGHAPDDVAPRPVRRLDV